jgi:cytoskeletal protein CcmA (bactofilin family)
MLIVLIAVGATVGLFLKDSGEKQKAQSVIDSQNLSEGALKQLANSDVTVGNSRQVLKVESNAIFSGSVLVRSDLEVAGTIKVGGELQLPGMSVTGNSHFNQLQADNLTIASNGTVQGAFVIKKGLTVSGNSSFDTLSAAQITTTAFQLNGELRLTNHITAGGPSPSAERGNAVGSGGTVSVNGSDTTGSIVVNTGSGTSAGCFATINFARKFNSTPHVVLTPIGSGGASVDYYVNRSSSQFSVCTANAAPGGQTFGFDYIVLN